MWRNHRCGGSPTHNPASDNNAQNNSVLLLRFRSAAPPTRLRRPWVLASTPCLSAAVGGSLASWSPRLPGRLRAPLGVCVPLGVSGVLGSASRLLGVRARVLSFPVVAWRAASCLVTVGVCSRQRHSGRCGTTVPETISVTYLSYAAPFLLTQTRPCGIVRRGAATLCVMVSPL